MAHIMNGVRYAFSESGWLCLKRQIGVVESLGGRGTRVLMLPGKLVNSLQTSSASVAAMPPLPCSCR